MCVPNPIRPRPNGCRRRVTAVRTAGRRRRSRRLGAIASRSRRARGHHRHRSRHLNRSRSPHPSPNSLGSQRNRSARPPRLPNRPRLRRALSRSPNRSRSRSPSRRLRNGSPHPRRESGYQPARRGATGCHPRRPIRRLSRRAKTAPPLNMSGGDGHPSPLELIHRLSRLELIHRLSRLELIHRLSRRCSPRPPNRGAAIQHHPRPSILGARLRHRHWLPNPGDARPIPSPSPSRRPNRRLRSRTRGGTAAQRTPAGSRLPSCSPGFKPPRPEAAVAGAAMSELGS